MPQGARIYNLFPLLAGPLPAWEKHLDRIAAMGFDWVFLNPVHYPGFSGSLYAVKDYYALNPLLTDGVRSSPEASLSEFLKAAEARGIAVMMDLGMTPVFYGQALAGPNLPHLRYITCASDLATHLANWKKFSPDPRWQKMKDLTQYAENTSKNTSRFLTPKPYSQI